MSGVPRRRWKTTIVVIASAVLLGVASTVAMAAGGAFASGRAGQAYGVQAANVPSLPGSVVDVTLTDMGPMMGAEGGSMMSGSQSAPGWPTGAMRLLASRPSVPAGTVSLRVFNSGHLLHELVVLPLAPGAAPGSRSVGSEGTVDEGGSLGEASRNNGTGHGDGIRPGAAGWMTLTLAPGHYELVCNLPGHYAARMHTELDVTGT